MIRTLHEGLLADGFAVPLTKLCTWFDVPRRTIYYKPVKSPPKIDPTFEDPRFGSYKRLDKGGCGAGRLERRAT